MFFVESAILPLTVILFSEIEQLNKSSAYMKNKIAEFEVKETEFEAQIKKHVDLVNHLEMEKNQVNTF